MQLGRRALLQTAIAIPLVTKLRRMNDMQDSFFGLHDGSGFAVQNLNVGAVRLWDVGVTWKDIEKSPGVFDFSRLDQLVSAAQNEGAAITYVLGQTPLFYTNNNNQASPPPLDKWNNYVRRVATRYQGQISHYQIWNEANVSLFFTGSPADMAALTKTAALAINDCDPSALVVGPSGPVRLAYQRQWYADFWAEKIGGYNSWRWINLNGFSMYPLAGDGPEAMFGFVNKMRNLMNDSGMPVAKQIIHASEINYDVEAGGATLLPDLDQIAMTMRTYLVGALAGIERMHWYRYDWKFVNGAPLANTYWTDPANFDSVTPAGLAFNRINNWLKGPATGYFINNDGTYIADFGTRKVAWNPNQTDRIFGMLGKTVTRCDGTSFVSDTDGVVVMRPTLFV